MAIIEEAIMILAAIIGTRAACIYLGASRSTLRRHKRPTTARLHLPRVSHRKLHETERQQILDTVHTERFADTSVREIYATLLNEGRYLASISTIYRILLSAKKTQERRRIATHPARVIPELMTSSANTLWSWDISKMAGPAKWIWYQLYAILDVFSRYIVGWRIEVCEDGALAEELFAEAIIRHDVDTSHLTIHADNGPAMTAMKTLGQLIIDLHITRSHSRPHVSNDNPFSEAQFKTMKYGPTYPDRFESIEAAREWFTGFVQWYNNEHHHVGIALLTPADVHFGRGEERRTARRHVLQAAHAAHPERFSHGSPEPLKLASIVYINPPDLER